MLFFLISILAGVLTVLAPCIFPLLPIVIGSAEPGEKKLSRRSIVVIASLSLSVIAFTLLLKASTLLITIPQSFWSIFSGIIIIIAGLALFFPELWAKIPLSGALSRSGDKVLQSGHQKKSVAGDMLIGAALGPVFTSCSPTYFFIIATVLPASFGVGLLYLLGFTLGLAISLLIIAFLGQQIIGRISKHSKATVWVKKVFAIVIILVGILILFGLDKKIETAILDSGYGATINFEQGLIDQFEPPIMDDVETAEPSVDVPNSLLRAFPDTDWSQVDPIVEEALSGGPGKDGIPAIENPEFLPISSFEHSDAVQAIVLEDGNDIKVYPYNILNWHEIVNDTIDGVPVAITFCPLCGSAIVYDRSLPKGETTFGVSGWLIESNMVMYDRDTESIWQQSTGKALAGEYFGEQLELIEFQLMSIGDVEKKYPNALILSENTGHQRNYARNPYSGYGESDDFIFAPSSLDNQFHSKTIMVAFYVGETPIATPWLELKDEFSESAEIQGEIITVSKEAGELEIKNENGEPIPFYFEMWFSWAVQHGNEGEVIAF
ncbi:MAG: DUF3179 domain-containing (seleno)protein [bacterium]|nr:DUF3179 domain-containing (seleno)protein [bacterium]